MPDFNQRKIEAVKQYGKEIVNDVLTFVGLFDPDGSYTAFQDAGMTDHSECVSFLYFEDLV